MLEIRISRSNGELLATSGVGFLLMESHSWRVTHGELLATSGFGFFLTHHPFVQVEVGEAVVSPLAALPET